MAKKVEFMIYSPKELWVKFCNWVFWPRHKKCSEWCDFYNGVLDAKIVEILTSENMKGNISDDAAEELEVMLKSANSEVSVKTAELMSEAYKDAD